MCLQWQCQKIVWIKEKLYADCYGNFGSSDSPKTWWSFCSLVLQINTCVFGMKTMNNLIDDIWGVCLAYALSLQNLTQCPSPRSFLCATKVTCGPLTSGVFSTETVVICFPWMGVRFLFIKPQDMIFLILWVYLGIERNRFSDVFWK